MRYDLIIIGTDLQIDTFKETFAGSNINIAVVGDLTEELQEYSNITCFKAPFELLDYRNRLFGCYLEGGIRLYSTTILVALGTKNLPLICKNKPVPNVYYNSKTYPKGSKDMQAIVLGGSQKCLRYALDISKKFRYVYVCSDSFELQGTEKQKARLEACKNVVVLPGTKLVNVVTKNGTLQTVELDTYSTITCSAIYADTPLMPNVKGVPNRFFQQTTEKFLLTSQTGESTLIPNLFATGTCCVEARDVKQIYNTVLSAAGGK